MNVEKVYKLHELLKGRHTAVSASLIASTLECSERNASRYIRFMREQFEAPIEYVEEYQGYRYSNNRFELPGLWFSPEEVLSLVALQKLMSDIGSGLLESQLKPLKIRIEKLLAARHLGHGELNRIKLLPMLARSYNQLIFQTVSSALLQRKQLEITYRARSDDATTERIISPQRLVRYRDNWYLDAWCHNKKALRNFSIDCILSAEVTLYNADEISDELLNNHFGSGYGIFAGNATNIAVLKFSPNRARWVSAEHWHPEQEGTLLDDGSYQLQVPYSDERELIGDIMRHLPHVTVQAPLSLKKSVELNLNEAIKSFK